jgi:hypothetical protein
MSKLSLGYRYDQLERKLFLMLGSQQDWLTIYANWLADNDSTEEDFDDHNIQLFVRQQKTGCPAKDNPPVSLPQRNGDPHGK